MKSQFDNQVIHDNLAWIIEHKIQIQTIGGVYKIDFNAKSCDILHMWRFDGNKFNLLFFLVDKNSLEMSYTPTQIIPVCGKYWQKIKAKYLLLSKIVDLVKNGELSEEDGLNLIKRKVKFLCKTVQKQGLNALDSEAVLDTQEHEDFLANFEGGCNHE